MSYNAKVYRILVASPSDVSEEREIIANVIQEWNDLHSYERKIVLLPLRWETHSAPQMGIRPQEVINKEVVDFCDMAVGVFWTRIGSQTGEYASGTIEEIERVGIAEKIVMLYFSNAKVDLESVDLEQYQKLRDFKKKTYPQALVENYRNIIEFRDKFSKQLEIKLRQVVHNEEDSSDLETFDNKPKLEVGLVDIETKSRSETILNVEAPKFDIDFELIESTFKKEKSNLDYDELVKNITKIIEKKNAKKITFYLENTGAVGIRDIYIEFRVKKNKHMSLANSYNFTSKTVLFADVASNINLSIEEAPDEYIIYVTYPALQPQRRYIFNDFFYISSELSARYCFNWRIFADNFSKPIIGDINLNIEVVKAPFDLKEFYDKAKKRSENVRFISSDDFGFSN
jgi:plasmid maintenance system killer protein